MNKDKKERTIVINNIDQPELYEQLEKVDNELLLFQREALMEDDEKYTIEDYLESLIKLDKAINGDRMLGLEKYYIGKPGFNVYRGQRCYKSSENTPTEYLNSKLLENIKKMKETFNKIYEEFPFDLTNTFRGIYPESYNDEKGENGPPIKWVISDQDNLSKIYYYFETIKKISEELVKKGMKTKVKEEFGKFSPTNELIEAMEDAQKELDLYCGYEGEAYMFIDLMMAFINDEFFYYKYHIINSIKLKDIYGKEIDISYCYKFLFDKCSAYTLDKENLNENEKRMNIALLKVMLIIAKMFVNNILLKIKDGKSDDRDLHTFDEYLEFIVNYYSEYDSKIWINKYREYTNKDLKALKEILEECKDLSPYASNAYKDLFLNK